MIAYKLFVENESGDLAPFGYHWGGFIYSRTGVNQPRKGYGPFACYDSLEAVAWDCGYLEGHKQFHKTRLFEVEITESLHKHIWSPWNKLPLSNGKLSEGVVLADEFKIVEQLELSDIKKRTDELGENWRHIFYKRLGLHKSLYQK